MTRLQAEIEKVTRERDTLLAKASRWRRHWRSCKQRSMRQSRAAKAWEDELAIAEARHAEARAAELTARAPLADAERKAQNLETQIATLSKLLNAGTGGFWPAVTEEISVAKGYEAALGAALGDDLDASTNPASPAHWAATDASEDPALPPGVEAARKACHGAGTSRAAAEPDRRRPAGGRRRLADSAETRPEARLEGRRSVALGRVHASRRSPDPRGAAARRKKPPRRSGDRGRSRARRRQRLENRWRSTRKRRSPPPPPLSAKPGKRIRTRCAKSRSRATKRPPPKSARRRWPRGFRRSKKPSFALMAACDEASQKRAQAEAALAQLEFAGAI